MSKIKDLEIGSNQLYASGFISQDYNQSIYLKRVPNDGDRSKYYMSVYAPINGELVRQAYLYFYMNHDTRTSDFIGMAVADEYRNLKIGSFLVANWIDFCFNNGYDFLGTNKKQRKPFLLYLLKTYGFEILDRSLYETREDVITICKGKESSDTRKLLLFKNPKHEANFLTTNVCQDDNYTVIHSLDNAKALDRVIVPLQNQQKTRVYYELLSKEKANQKVKQVLKQHTK